MNMDEAFEAVLNALWNAELLNDYYHVTKAWDAYKLHNKGANHEHHQTS